MNTTAALVVAAIAGAIAVGAAFIYAASTIGGPITARKDKKKCDDKDGCKETEMQDGTHH